MDGRQFEAPTRFGRIGTYIPPPQESSLYNDNESLTNLVMDIDTAPAPPAAAAPIPTKIPDKPCAIQTDNKPQYITYTKTPWPTANPLFQPICSEKSRAVKNSMLLWLNKMQNGGDLEDFHNIIQDFLRRGLSKTYCTKVLKTIAAHLKKRDPNYVNPLKDNNRLVSNAFSNACKINFRDGKYFTETGEVVTPDFYSLYKIKQKSTVDLKQIDQFYYAARRHIIQISPVALNLKPILCITKPAPEFAIDETHQNIVSQCKAELVAKPLTNPILTETHLLICLLFESGARSKEFLDMKVGQARTLIEKGVVNMMCKTGLNDFMVNHNVREYLRGYLARVHLPNESFLFTRQFSKHGVAKTEKIIRKTFRQLWKKQFGRELPPQSGFHMFRHYLAVRTDKDNAQLMMRHESAQTTAQYRKMFGVAFSLQQQQE